jgi:hypothetical protein
MSASVRIEDEAFSDRRYDRLAREAGLADADHARGKMAVLWRQCTLEQRHILPPEDVMGVLGDDGVRALVASRLGSETPSGVRIHGTEGRIEWLTRLRKNGKYGHLGAEHGKKGGRPRKPPEAPLEGVSENPPPAPAPAPVKEIKRPESGKTKPPPPPEAVHIADDIAKHVLSRDPGCPKLRTEEGRKKTVDAWAGAIRLLHERDGRPWPQIAEVWRWARKDEGFWAGNILSGQTLRKQFDKLVIASKQHPAQRNGRPAPVQPKLTEDWGSYDAAKKETR